jgi:hypothetical protein
VQRGQLLLVDTNIIIEAVRTRCWNAISTHFAIETVEKCYEEALTGDPLRPGYVTVDPVQLRKGLVRRHDVTDLERAQLALRVAEASALDAGERDLFAHALARKDAWVASCADRAAVNVALALGWEGRVISLERLVQAAGSRSGLKRHFTEAWLSEVRTAYKLGRALT